MSLPTTLADSSAAEMKAMCGDSFKDLDRACHRFLMERDPNYRKSWEAMAEKREASNARKASRKARF